MNSSYLNNIQDCEIDNNGSFKYIQIKLNFQGQTKTIIRGWNGFEYHKDNYINFLEKESQLLKGIDSEVLGGGRISINMAKKTCKVNGYSISYGICDHSLSCKLINEVYPDIKTSFSNDGY